MLNAEQKRNIAVTLFQCVMQTIIKKSNPKMRTQHAK